MKALMSFQIGNVHIKNPYILAPMASVSEMPFRVIALELGASLAPTELISSKGIFYKNRRTLQYLTYDKAKEIPYAVQLFGGDVEVMAKAAHVAWKHGAHIIDINMGCPAKKVCNKAAGSALLRDEALVSEILQAVVQAVSIPVTLKIRTGWDSDNKNALTIGKIAEDAGYELVDHNLVLHVKKLD